MNEMNLTMRECFAIPEGISVTENDQVHCAEKPIYGFMTPKFATVISSHMG